MPELRPLVGDCEAITGPSPCMASPLFCSWLAFSLQAGCLAIFSTKQPVNLLKLGQLQSWVHGPDWPPSPPAATKDRQVLCKICLNTCLGIFLLSPHFFAQNIFVGQTECRYAIHVSVPGSWRFISLQNIFINAQKWLDFLEVEKPNALRECEE